MRTLTLVSALALSACNNGPADAERKAQNAARLEASMARGRAMLEENERITLIHKVCREGVGASVRECAQQGERMIKAQERIKRGESPL